MKINVKIPKKINIGGIKTGTPPYTLPIASADTLGGIKVGENLTITEDGTLNAQAGGSGGVSLNIGSIYITSTNENPSLRLGGEWELIDKHFKEWSYYSSDVKEIAEYVTPSNNATPYAFGIIRSEHSVYIRYYFRNVFALNEQKVSIGTLKFEKFGINNGLYFGIYDISAGSEEGIALMNISSSTGEMYCSDVVVKGNIDYIPTNTQIRFEVEARTPVKYMLDEHCDKFFWKKIA